MALPDVVPTDEFAECRFGWRSLPDIVPADENGYEKTALLALGGSIILGY